MSLGETYLSFPDRAGRLGKYCHPGKSRELQDEGVTGCPRRSEKQRVHALQMGNGVEWAGTWGTRGEGGGGEECWETGGVRRAGRRG